MRWRGGWGVGGVRVRIRVGGVSRMSRLKQSLDLLRVPRRHQLYPTGIRGHVCPAVGLGAVHSVLLSVCPSVESCTVVSSLSSSLIIFMCL